MIHKEGIAKVKVSLTLPPKEYAMEAKNNFQKLNKELLGEKKVTFLAKQFKGLEVGFEIVNLNVQPEAVVACLDDFIQYVLDDKKQIQDIVLDENSVANDNISIIVDLGGGTLDLVAIQNLGFLGGSERTEYIGVVDTLQNISKEIVAKYNLKDNLPTALINQAIRYTKGVCTSCGKTFSKINETEKKCGCGGSIELKKNILANGISSYDISDIVEATFEATTNKITQIVTEYKNELLKSLGIPDTQFERIIIVGGGAEMYGEMLVNKIKNSIGRNKIVIKSNNAVWKTVNGLRKYTIYSDKDIEKDFDYYVFIDVGNSSTKAVISDKMGNLLNKPIELLTQYAVPTQQSLITLLAPRPLDDLNLKIEGSTGQKGLGTLVVSTLANKGFDRKTRNNATIGKADEEITYVMANSVIATLLGLDW